jgi:DMSO/TMAO reductase YedYZ heme-binding membrane subunit
MVPLVLTSFDRAQRYLGSHWRSLHLLVIPIFILAILHILCLGSHYLGTVQFTLGNTSASVGLGVLMAAVLLVRWRRFWAFCCLEHIYERPCKEHHTP